MTDRREFLRAAAMTAGAVAAGGCGTLCGRGPFYGPTIRDRLWMWGHHPDQAAKSVRPGERWPGPTVDQAEGCRLMGIPNDCFIRWGNKPAHPWGNYIDQFRSLKRFSFDITDDGNGTIWDKVRWATEEIKPAYPNLTGCFLDDFFSAKECDKTDADALGTIADTLHANDLRLSVVLYSDEDGLKPEFRKHLSLCDETSYWFWRSENIGTMGDSVRRCRDFIGPEKDLLLGLYMWDFTTCSPVRGDRMEKQLAHARRFLSEGVVTGLIFHPSYAAALDIDAVRLAKQWIRSYGEDPWGVA